MTTGITLEHVGRVATLTVDRPPLNILDLAMLGELDSTLKALGDEDDLQLLVIRGGGSRAFCAGVSVQDHTPDRIEEMLETFHSCLRRLLAFPAPTVAAVAGHCLGGGMELAAACDLRLAEAGSSFGQPEIELGCYPPWAAAHYPELLGVGMTVDLLLTGRTIDTQEAVQTGFVQRIIEKGDLDEALGEFREQVTRHSCAVTRLAIRAIRSRRTNDFESALGECERLYTEELTRTHDMNEGLEAFVQKRRPEWQHR